MCDVILSAWCKIFVLVPCYLAYIGGKLPTFRDNLSTPSLNRLFRKSLPNYQFMLRNVYCLTELTLVLNYYNYYYYYYYYFILVL
jgi:hypothetical protein